MRVLLFFSLILFTYCCSGQIVVFEKDFEQSACYPLFGGTFDSNGNFAAIPTCNTPCCSILGYYRCDLYTFIPDFSDSNVVQNFAAHPQKAFKGNNSVALSASPNNAWGTWSTKLPCFLKRGREYRFDIALVALFHIDYFYNNNGQLDSIYYIAAQNINIWGNSDSCSRQEVIWQSPILDTAWHKYNAILAPKESDYEFIHFRHAKLGTTGNSGDWFAMMDDLSDIYPFNAHAFDSVGISRDIVVHVGQCVPLSVTPSITTYDSVAWYQITPSGRVKITNGFSTTVCPTENSTYLIAMRDTVPDCAGIWWSFDTVRVTVDTTVGIRTISKAKGYEVQLAPNPVQNNIQLQILHDRVLIHEPIQFQLIDMLGRVAFTREVNNEEIIDLSTLPLGVYSVALRVKDWVWVSKVVKQ